MQQFSRNNRSAARSDDNWMIKTEGLDERNRVRGVCRITLMFDIRRASAVPSAIVGYASKLAGQPADLIVPAPATTAHAVDEEQWNYAIAGDLVIQGCVSNVDDRHLGSLLARTDR